MKNKLQIFLSALFTVMLLQGCNGNDQDDVSAPPENAPVEHENHTTDTEQNRDLFAFTSFDLDVDYKDNKSYEVSYENENSGMEAEIEDTVNNEKLNGDHAFEQLKPIFENFSFNKDTPEDEVIAEVLSAFELAEDYQQLELEVDFADGTKKEYKR